MRSLLLGLTFGLSLFVTAQKHELQLNTHFQPASTNIRYHVTMEKKDTLWYATGLYLPEKKGL